MSHRLAREILAAAKDMLVCTTISIPRIEGVEARAYNEIHYELQRFADRVRRNEGMESFMARKDTDEEMTIEAGFSDHDEKDAIVREMVSLASKVCARNGIERIRTRSS